MYKEIKIKSRAVKDLKKIPHYYADNILSKIEKLKLGVCTANVKQLTNYTSEYRLRVGKYRILFSIEESIITVWRVLHRKDAYRVKEEEDAYSPS